MNRFRVLSVACIVALSSLSLTALAQTNDLKEKVEAGFVFEGEGTQKFKVEIEGVTQGAFLTLKGNVVLGSDGSTTRSVPIEQSLDLKVSTDDAKRVRVRATSTATLTLTGARKLQWKPTVTGTGRCLDDACQDVEVTLNLKGELPNIKDGEMTQRLVVRMNRTEARGIIERQGTRSLHGYGIVCGLE